MNQTETIDVTYVGPDDPFVDRMYRSGLTFTNGQSRPVPPVLAERFLRHSDVFKRTEELGAAPKKAAEVPKDDTQDLLNQAKKQDDSQRLQEEARFALIDQLDSMDKKALIDWADRNYKQKIPGNLGLEKVRERAKGFLDQYGAP